MKRLHWMATLAVLLLCTSAAFADSTPPDGAGNLKGVGDPPVLITSNTYNFTFNSCPGGDGCSFFTGSTPATQAAFAATNATGTPWSYLDLTLNFAAGTQFQTGDVLNCNGGGLFTVYGGACGQTIASSVTTCPAGLCLTAVFQMGTGTGIGCDDGLGTSYDNTCDSNSAYFDGQSNYYYQTDCSAARLPTCIDGPSTFAVGVGGWFDNSGDPIPPTGGTIVTPEPSTVLLLGVGAMLAMLFLGLKKASLVHA